MSNKYKPPVVKDSSGKGESGVASLTWGDKKLQIEFNESGKKFKVLLDELPEYCQEWKFLTEAFVTMKGNNEEVLGIRPLNGVFPVKFSQVASKEDEPPAPMTIQGKFGPYQAFTVLLEVVKGKYEGGIFPYFLNYKFADSDGVVAIYGSGASSAKLADFLDCAGVWDQGELEFDDNILPALQKRMKSAKKIFQVVVKKGYVESVMEAEFEDADEDEAPKKKSKAVEVDEEEAPKKKSKKPVDDDDDL